jgi:hypothetical protein
VFRAAERIISAQPWYNGGYRANIVAYTLAVLGEIAKRRKSRIDFLAIWNTQGVDDVIELSIAATSGVVNDDITRPPGGISNISEWCKREACWTRIQTRIGDVEKLVPAEFYDRMLSLDDQTTETKSAKKTQRIDNGIEAQRHVLAVSATDWSRLHKALLAKDLLTPKEVGVLQVAMQIPVKIPTEKQCAVLLDVLTRGRAEGIELGS